MMMAESEPTDLDQCMNDSNWLVAMQEELRKIEKNKTWEHRKDNQEVNLCEVGLQVEAKTKWWDW